MKRTPKLIAAVSAALVLAGCGNSAQQTTTTTAATTTAAEATTTTTTTATASEPETTAAASEPETTAAAAEDNSGKTVFFTDIQGDEFYREDTVKGDWQISVPYGFLHLSSGMYFDTDANPELFTPDEFLYNGEKAPAGTLVRVAAGDTIGSLTVKAVDTAFNPPWDDAPGDVNFDADEGFMYSHTVADFSGEVELTGVLRYYYDELYTISSGDMIFIPDSSYAGLPLAVDISSEDANIGTVNFDQKAEGNEGFDSSYAGGLCVYSEAPSFRLGNLKENYSDRTDLYELVDGANANCTKRVRVTLTDVHIEWNDNFGSAYACSAKLGSVSEL